MNVVTISREFGSGGRELGKRLADALGYHYIDSELINLIADDSSFDPDYVKEMIEKGNYPIHYSVSFDSYLVSDNMRRILESQRKVLKDLTEHENCVIVGRGANELLGDNVKKFSIFVHASTASKLARTREREVDETVSDKEIIKKMKRIDKNRMRYNAIYFGVDWGKKENYDMTINTTYLKIKDIIPSLSAYIKIYLEGKGK